MPVQIIRQSGEDRFDAEATAKSLKDDLILLTSSVNTMLELEAVIKRKRQLIRNLIVVSKKLVKAIKQGKMNHIRTAMADWFDADAENKRARFK